MGPQNSLRTKYVVPVSKRKETDGPDTMISTWGSLSELTVVGSKEPRSVQSSTARPRRPARRWSMSDVPVPRGTRE